MIQKSVSGSCLFLALVAVPAWSAAATVCVDREEFAGLIQRVEQVHKELANVKIQVALYKQANDVRKDEIRIKDEYVLLLEQRMAVADELEAAHAQREQASSEAIDRAHWWRNVGWGTAVAGTIGAIVFGVLK
jgi:hypothetical protein